MPSSFNPQDVPVVGIDDHLPAVAASSLRAESLRERFGARPVWVPEFERERKLLEREPAHASVLVPLVMREELTVLLTRRTDHLTDHPGQISFPGGRAEPGDVDAVATALREAREEIGLDPAHVEVLGSLPTYTTVTSFIVTPVIALVRPEFVTQADPFEVAEVFEVPLAFIMNPAHHRRHAIEVGAVRREFLSMPWDGTDLAGLPQRYFIWGATAAMLRNFYRFLAAGAV
jgi:8-oxo-dGTP pyrophosphatase MutT (NUDIX family)